MFKRLVSTKVSERSINVSLFLLRVTIALVMIPHGYQKMVNFGEMKTKFMSFLGIGSEISLALVIGAELFCSIFLALGLLTRFALIPLIIAMIVAIIEVHQSDIFGEAQLAFLYLIIYIALFISGPGKFSADHFIFRRK